MLEDMWFRYVFLGRQIFKITSFTYLNICTLYAWVVLFTLFSQLLLPKHSLSLCPHLVPRTVVRNSQVQIPLAQTIEMLLKIFLLYHSDNCINFSMKFSMKTSSFLSTWSVFKLIADENFFQYYIFIYNYVQTSCKTCQTNRKSMIETDNSWVYPLHLSWRDLKWFLGKSQVLLSLLESTHIPILHSHLASLTKKPRVMFVVQLYIFKLTLLDLIILSPLYLSSVFCILTTTATKYFCIIKIFISRKCFKSLFKKR